MKNKIFVMFSMLVLLLSFTLPALGAQHGKVKPEKKGILLVAFGSSIPEALVAFEHIEKKVREAFPEVPIRWAFTSHMIRKKMADEGKNLESVTQALADMAEKGFTHVAVQSLHTISGEEFHELNLTVRAFRNIPEGFDQIMTGLPLLGNQKDMERVVAAILSIIPEQRKPEDAVLLMGHGTNHPSNTSYAALMWQLQLQDPNLFLGVVEGFPEINDILPILKERKIQKVWLMPFMSIAGDHARNDMAGPEEDSWKSILLHAGMNCEVILRGTGEYDEFVEIWIDHIRNTINRF
jgi:sirohydrochlorin cobaltochelatase